MDLQLVLLCTYRALNKFCKARLSREAEACPWERRSVATSQWAISCFLVVLCILELIRVMNFSTWGHQMDLVRR